MCRIYNTVQRCLQWCLMGIIPNRISSHRNASCIPFQEYVVEWDNIGTIKYDENGVVGNYPIADIKTLRGDIPFSTTMTHSGESLPCYLGFDANVVPNAIDAENYTTTLYASNGYASFHADVKFEYVGNLPQNYEISNKSGIMQVEDSVEFEPRYSYGNDIVVFTLI